MFADKYVHYTKDVPDEPHWAIIQNTSTFIEGDERSRTNPGHGYPAHTENNISYEVYLTQEKWQQTIKQLTDSRTTFKAMYVQPALIETKLEVTVNV